ncbi:MAG: hypothetical protein ACLFR7_04705 [Opitutales bacterium]
MSVDLEEELKRLDKERERIDEKKRALQEQLEEQAKAEEKLQDLFEKSGYPTPRALIVALAKKYNVRVSGLSMSEGRRKRTKVSPQLRDDVKAAVNGGLSKNQASKQFEISYLVVNKIMDGKYDDL